MFQLSDYSTDPPKNSDRKKLEKITKDNIKKIGTLQRTMKAEGKHSILVILQGMDASGKDGAVKKVFETCSRDGVHIKSFKQPTKEELGHDFLWRVHKDTPRQGMIQIFNRSHYEDILIQRVHGWIDEKRAAMRMRAINSFEQLLEQDNGTKVLKFYLHISKEQQVIELKQRLDDPKKRYKHSNGDWEERLFWDEYMSCYEDAIVASEIPWIITPVDQRWYRDYIISTEVLKTLKTFNPQYPDLKEPISDTVKNTLKKYGY